MVILIPNGVMMDFPSLVNRTNPLDLSNHIVASTLLMKLCYPHGVKHARKKFPHGKLSGQTVTDFSAGPRCVW